MKREEEEPLSLDDLEPLDEDIESEDEEEYTEEIVFDDDSPFMFIEDEEWLLEDDSNLGWD